MCGRTACALCKDDVQKACTFKNKNSGKYELPEWGKNPKCKQDYKPSYNVAPTDITPVIISGTHFETDSQRMLQPMMWGMIPAWHRGDYRNHGLTTNNCRIEGLLNSKLYSRPFNKGNRCVIVCDGFYEWQTSKGKGNKQPYFIYMPQEDGMQIENHSTWTSNWDEDVGWTGPRLLYMAGLFDIWTSQEGEELYSYSVITMESNESMSWCHHRMPAILEQQQIEGWLDVERVSAKEAIAMIKPIKLLAWHPVSTLVNNSRHKDPECNKAINLNKPKRETGSQLFMKAWLKKNPIKQEPQEVKKEPASQDQSELDNINIKLEQNFVKDELNKFSSETNEGSDGAHVNKKMKKDEESSN